MRRLALLFAALAALAGPARAEEVNPPFGLRWGETPERLERLLTGARAKIVSRREVEQRVAWDVEGLVQPGLKRTVFYLKGGSLDEVELQYQFPEWDAEKYEAFMGQIRRRIEAKFGPAIPVARSKKPEGEITQTLVGYKWTQPTTMIQLFYFAAEKTDLSYRTVSIHYRLL